MTLKASGSKTGSCGKRGRKIFSRRVAVSLLASGLLLAIAAVAWATSYPPPSPPSQQPPLVPPYTTPPPVTTPPWTPSPGPTPPPWNAPSPPGVPPAFPPEKSRRAPSLPAGATRPRKTSAPIYLQQGAVVEQTVDLVLPGPVQDFLVTRSYDSRVSGSVALGGKWVGNFADDRLVQSGAYNVALIVNATSQRLFSFVPYPTPSYTSPADSTLSLQRDSTNSQFILTDWVNGEVKLFHDFTRNIPADSKRPPPSPGGQPPRKGYATPPTMDPTR